jgi:acetyl esterase/lipase
MLLAFLNRQGTWLRATRGWVTVLVALGLFLAGPCKTFAAEPPPPESYGRLPQIGSVSLAPGGQVFAALVRNSEGAFVTVFDAATAKPIDILALGNDKFRSMFWIDDDRLVIIRSITSRIEGVMAVKGEQFVALEHNFRTRRGRPLLADGDRALNTVVGDVVRVRPPTRPASLILGGMNFPQSTGVYTLFEQGASGRPEVVAQGQRDTVDWIVGPDGTVLGEVRQSRTSGNWQVLVGPGIKSLKPVREGSHQTRAPALRGVSPDGSAVYLSIPADDDYTLFRVDVASGQMTEIPSDQGQTFVHEDGTLVVVAVARSIGDDLTYDWSNPQDRELWAAVTKGFKGARVEVVSMSAARDRLILLAEGGGYGYGYYLLDRKSGRASFLSDVYAGIGPEAINERRYIRFKAGDGLEIPAYLTLPTGRPAKGLPLIVLPHGGPAVRDDIGFDWWSQAYAAMGYAVLQPQFRGSRGFGAAHQSAGDGEVGGRMQTDLSDGVADLVRTGVADPARVAIVGASYGGYAALAGVTLQSGLYRCAVSVAGVSDWAQFVRDSALAAGGSTRVRSVRYWRQVLRVADEKDPKLTGISPRLQASRASAPILLIHGADDTVVKIAHSTKMEEALRKAGKPVEMLTLKGEDHWLSSEETRVQMLTASSRFLKTCNPPGGA